MTTTHAQAVLDRMESDEEFAQRVRDAGGPEPALATLRAEGFEVTKEEVRDAVLDRYGDTLSNEQLDAIAGGEDTTVATAVVVGVPVTIAVVGAAGAAAV